MEPTNNRREFANWFISFYDEMYSYALKSVKNAMYAQDILQETFLAAMQGYDVFKKQSSARTWLYAILRKKIVDHYRKTNSAETDIEENKESESVEDFHLLDDPDFLRIYKRALASLPRLWRKVLLAKYFEEKNSAEICELYNISKENYWQIMRRAKLLLKDKLIAFNNI